MGGREEQRDLWLVTPTSSCLSSSRTKGRVLFLTLMGAGDNSVLGFHRLAVGSHILGLRVLVLDSHKTGSALFPRPTLRLNPPRLGHMLETSCLPREYGPAPGLSLLNLRPATTSLTATHRQTPNPELNVEGQRPSRVSPSSQKRGSSRKEIIYSNDFFKKDNNVQDNTVLSFALAVFPDYKEQLIRLNSFGFTHLLELRCLLGG